jgi:type II secretory pathway component GspD/PulD (secretin)
MQLGKNWDLAANALATDSRVNVVQRPRVLTSHATPGSFQVGSEVPFVTGSFNGGSFGNSTQIQRQFVGVALDVIPFITPDSLVVMEINQTIDQLGPSVSIDGNDVPSTQTRSASSTVTVRNKEAILLGGYITSNTSRSKAGVPILSSIPVLGNLFSSRSRNGARTELMVLMRPTVLPTPTDAANMADEERARLPGVRVAEQEFEQTEREENRKADKQNAAAKKREQREKEKAVADRIEALKKKKEEEAKQKKLKAQQRHRSDHQCATKPAAPRTANSPTITSGITHSGRF